MSEVADTYRDRFRDKLVEFCDVLTSHFPDVEQFVLAKTLIHPACLIDGDALVPIMKEVYLVREMIFSRDEQFFIQDKNKMFSFGEESRFNEHTDSLRSLWIGGRMDDEMKETAWVWLKVLAMYCLRYGEKANW